MIIAIDGTAGSGKGTLAKNLSSKLNLKHLDTGVLFRIIASQAIKLSISNNDKRIIDLCKNLTIDKVIKTENCERKNLRSNIVGKKASEIALNINIRNELINFQRKYIRFDKSLYNGVILDGRDIGTVVFPDADYKFYLDANVKIRAKRIRRNFWTTTTTPAFFKKCTRRETRLRRPWRDKIPPKTTRRRRCFYNDDDDQKVNIRRKKEE